MKERGWLSAERAEPMLKYLGGRTRKRKLRLFACACCRRVWRFFTRADAASRQAVAASEKFADGLISRAELARLQTDPADVLVLPKQFKTLQESAGWLARRAAVKAAAWASRGSAAQTATAARWVISASMYPYSSRDAIAQEHLAQADLFRDIFGNPFRRVAIDLPWLKWNDATVIRLAQRIYDERRFADLLILADALEEAGCTSADILDHCRGPGPHVRGCWAVDLILGKD